MEFKMIKVIFIDIDDTLLDFRKGAEQAIKMNCAEYGVPYSERLLSVFFESNAELWSEIEKGTLTKPELYKKRWPLIFSRLGIEYARSDLFEESYRANFASIAIPVDGAAEMLSELSKEYRLFVASNSSYDMQISRLSSVGMLQYFDGVFVSEKIGYFKPSVEFFEQCLRNVGDCEKSELLMLGDSLTADISGGKAFGIKTCYFDRQYANSAKYDVIPDVTVTDLREVKKVIQNM